jgi:hypothetical protein
MRRPRAKRYGGAVFVAFSPHAASLLCSISRNGGYVRADDFMHRASLQRWARSRPKFFKYEAYFATNPGAYTSAAATGVASLKAPSTMSTVASMSAGSISPSGMPGSCASSATAIALDDSRVYLGDDFMHDCACSCRISEGVLHATDGCLDEAVHEIRLACDHRSGRHDAVTVIT